LRRAGSAVGTAAGRWAGEAAEQAAASSNKHSRAKRPVNGNGCSRVTTLNE
jgi:hypothetical protein